jgi:hypothetical protein
MVSFSPSHWPVVGKRYHAFFFQATVPFELCAVIIIDPNDETSRLKLRRRIPQKDEPVR